ncbi:MULTISPECIES: hypothetical protein [Floridanema]|uniref:Uncharacterized protein n=2 Tax=Floridanema TaxID=3396149 RepID=A0ABV4Y1E7_9CYAN
MDSLEKYQTNDKTRMILDATEKIETVMGFDPHFQSYQQPIAKVEIPPSESAGLLILWFLVLFIQFLMFWQQKNK